MKKMRVGDRIRVDVHPAADLPPEPPRGSVVAWNDGTVWVKRGPDDWVPTTDRNIYYGTGPYGEIFPDSWPYVLQESGGKYVTVLRVGKKL